jgi:hypothetical protein
MKHSIRSLVTGGGMGCFNPKQNHTHMKDTHWAKNPLENSITDALCDAYDIRNVLSAKIKNRPKDNEGTEFTIGDCLDTIVSTLEEMESVFEEIDDETNTILMEAAWFALRHHYQDLAEYLDLSDDVLKPIMEKLDQQLNDNE